MAKDVKKKFTISLDIGVREAEQQLKNAATNIKQTLNNIAQETNSLKYFNELHKQMSQVDSLMGAMKNKYGDGFEDIFKQIGASMGKELSGVFDIANDKLNEFKTDIAGEEQKLNNLKALLSDFNKASKQGKQAIDGDDITGFKGTKKEVQELYASFDELIKKKNDFETSGDFSSERYIKNYIKLMKTAAGLVNADNLSFNEGKYFGIDEIALSEKAEEATRILKEMFSKGLSDQGSSSYVYDWINSSVEVAKKSMSDMAEAMAAVMKDSIHNALNISPDFQNQDVVKDMSDQVKKETENISRYYDIVKKKMEEYYEVYKTLESSQKGTPEYTEAFSKQFAIQEEITKLKNIGEDEKNSIYDIFDGFYEGDFTIDEALNDICKVLQIDIPNAAEKTETGLTSAMGSVEIKVNDIVAGFKKLIEYISTLGHDPGSFFNSLASGAQILDKDIKNILSSLNLLDENGNAKFSSIQSGFSNTGGMISDDYVLISRDEDKLPFSMETKQKSLDAKAMGANIGAVLEVYEDKANGIIYELQNKVKGKAILDFEKGIINTEFLSATEDQIEKLISDLEILRKTGLFVDWGGSNVLFSKDTGFSFIDFFSDSVEPYTVGKKNGIQENLQMFFGTMLKKFNLSGSDSLDIMAFKNQVESMVPGVLAQQKAQENIVDTTNNVRIATDAVADSVKNEEMVHKQNTDTINAENKALQAQIELKKKAQSMKWEDFALDESLSGKKKDAGLSTISSWEKFWKDANYEKDVDFYQIDKNEVGKIFNRYPGFLDAQDDWYGGADFAGKDVLENMLLANDELRNAAMNQMWQVYREFAHPFEKVNSVPGVDAKISDMLDLLSPSDDIDEFSALSDIYKKVKNIRARSINLESFDDESINSVFNAIDDFEYTYGQSLSFVKDYIRAATIEFDDFISREFEVYRGTEGGTPALYGSEQTVSFSFNKDIANWFDGSVATTKITPKNTIGNASVGNLKKEAEVFVPSLNLPYIVETDQSFDDFFQNLDDSTKKTIDAALVQQEINRVKKLLGDDLTAALENASGWDDFKNTTIESFKQGIVPDKILSAKNLDIENFANLYNTLNEMQKKMVAYYVSLSNNGSNSFLSSSEHIKNGRANILNAVMNDPSGLEAHVDKLTGESLFGMLGQNTQFIQAEIEAHNKNTQAISAEHQAQNALNDAKQVFSEVQHKIAAATLAAEGGKESELNSIWNSMSDVFKTELDTIDGNISSNILNDGFYQDHSTGELLSYDDIIEVVNNFEKTYGDNLDYVKEYLNKVFEKYNTQIDAFLSGTDISFVDDSIDFEDELILDGFKLTDDDVYGHKEDTRPVVAEQQLEVEQQITAEKKQQAQLDALEDQTGADVSSIENESIALHNLILKINDVEQAVRDKTQAFIDEGNTVDQVVDQELIALSKLTSVLEDIRIAVESIGNISIAGDIDESNLQNVDAPVVNSDNMGEHREIDTHYALDQTLLTTNGILENILAAVGNNESNERLSDTLSGAITELKNVASGIVQHQKAQQIDKSAASAKIANNYGQLSDILGNAVSSLGDETQIKQMKALADGVVRVEGAVRETDGAWKGFVVDIDESNNAVIRAIDEHSAFAKMLNEEAEAAKKAAEKAKTESPQNKFNQSLSAQKTAFNDYRKNLQDVDYLSDEAKDGLDELALKLKTISDSDDLRDWIEDFDYLKNAISNAETKFSNLEKEKIKDFRGQLNSEFKNLDFTTITSDPTDEQKEILDLRMQLIEQLEEYKIGIKNGKAVELDVLNATMAALREKINLYREANNLESGGKQKFGATVALNATAKFNSLQQKANSGEFANSAVVQQALAQYETAYNNLIAKRKELSQVEGRANDVQQAEFKQLQNECNNYAKALNKIITDSQKLESQFVNPDSYFLGGDFEDSIEGRKAALTDFVQQTYGVSVAAEDFKNNWNEVVFAVDNGDGTFTEMTATFNAARTQIGALAGDVKKTTGVFESFVNELKGKFKSLSAYLISSLSIHEVWQQVRKGVEYVREIDLALTELKKVTDATEQSYKHFLTTASEAASEVGSTIAEFTDATADFARLGYDISQASELARAASVYKNVGDGINDIATASESIISTMKAFGVEANSAMGIVDRFNEVGNNFAISSTGIGEALKRSASALYAGGNTIDEAIALVTAANSVIQNPEQVGTALKTLTLRLRGAKVELEEAGEDVDGMAESTSQLQAKLKALTHGKVDIMLDADTFKNTTQILREMSTAWEDMTDIERASALELMGGKRQANILSSLITNFETVEDVIETSMNSSGSAMAENAKWMDSIAGKSEQLSNNMQAMWENTLNSDVVKWFYDLAIGVTDLVKDVGLLPPALAAVLVYFKAFKNIGPISLGKDLLASASSTISVMKQVKTLNLSGFMTASNGVLDASSVKVYANVLKEMSAQQQAAILTSNGFSKAQAAQVLAQNEVEDATIRQLLGLESLNTAKQATTTITGAQAAAMAAEGKVQLSNASADWVAKQGEDQLTIAKVQNAVATGQLTLEQGKEIISTFGLIGANKAASISFKTLGASIKAAFLSNPIGWIMMAVSGIMMLVTAVDQAEEKIDEVISKASEIKSNFNSVDNEISKNISTIKGLESEFATLSKCVDENGNNISLTAEDYERYQEIVASIIDMTPDVIEGYDAEGKAIISKNELLERSIELLKEEQKLEAQRFASTENWKALAQGLQAEIADAPSKENTKINFGKRLKEIMNDDNWNWYNWIFSSAKEGASGFEQLSVDMFESQYPQDKIENFIFGRIADVGSLLQSIPLVGPIGSKIAEKILSTLMSDYNANYMFEFIDYIKENENKLIEEGWFSQEQIDELLGYELDYYHTDNLESMIKEYQDEYTDLLFNAAKGTDGFYKLDDQQQGFLKEYIDAAFPVPTDGDVESQLYDAKKNLYNFIEKIADDEDLKLLIPIGYNLEQGLDEDGKSMSLNQYKKKIQDFINDINGMTNISDEDKKNILGSFDIYVDGIYRIPQKIQEAEDHVRSIIGSDEWQKYQNTFTTGQLLEIKYHISAEPGSMSAAELKQELQNIKNSLGVDVNSVKTYSSITESIDSINEVLLQTSEIVADNTEVSQEYKDALTELGISSEDLADCFYESNPLVIKNADALNTLIKDTKKTTAQNIKLAKSQAKLEYYKKYKELKQLTNGQKITNAATLSQVKALYQEMSALQKTISKYSMLEHQLLGATNAYEEFTKAQEIDATNDYESKAEELVSHLVDAFHTAKLGTESAQAAIKGLVPESIYEDLDTLDEKMQAVYDYFTTDLSKYFYVKFNDDGSLESAEMLIDNVKQFVEDGIGNGVFTGSWEEWDLDSTINSLDELAKKMKVTKEVAYAFLQAMETYDISWIGGDASTLLDKLVPSSAEIEAFTNQIQEQLKNTSIDVDVQPQVNTEKLKEQGYTVDDGQTFEVLSYQDADGSYVNLTPVLPDGSVVSKDSFDKYIQDQLNAGGSLKDLTVDGYKVYVDTYDTQDAAEKAAKQLESDIKDYHSMVKSYSLESAIYTNTQKQAELQYKIGTGEITADTIVSADGKTTAGEQLSQLNQEAEENARAARENIAAWTEASKSYEDAKEAVNNLNKELSTAENGMTEGGKSIADVQAELEKAEGTMWDTYAALVKCGEPTEVTLTVAMEQVQADMEKVKATMSETELDIVSNLDISNLEKDDDGQWIVELEAYSNLDEASKARVQQYLDYLAEEHNINILQGEGAVTTLDVLNEIKDILAQSYELLVEAKVDDSSITTWWEEFSAAPWYKKVSMVVDKVFGGDNEGGYVDVNGTAHASGTAHAGGSWGAPRTETALTGELGPEILVRNGRWTTVGENGAEFTQIKKGDIIFNHKQSEQLLKNGYVTGRGKAYVGGTAYAGEVHPWTGGMNIDADWQNITLTLWNTATNGEYLADSIDNAADSLGDASDAADDFAETFDWIEVRLEEINEQLDLMNAQLENAGNYTSKNNIIDQIMGVNTNKMANLMAGIEKYSDYAARLLTDVPAQYREAAQNGAIAITEFVGEADEKTVEAIEKYREWAQKVADLKQELEGVKTELRELAIQKIDNAEHSGSVRAAVEDSQTEKLQNAVDLDETSGLITSPAYYTAMMENSGKTIEYLTKARNEMQKEFNDAVESGNLVKGDDDWYEQLNKLYQIDAEIDEANIELEEFQNKINDIYWDNFDQLINRLDYIKEDTQSLIDLMDSDDMVITPETDDGWTADQVEWTKEGMATLGLYAQQMETAEYEAKQYAKAIDDLTAEYEAGHYSENEYLEKLNELKKGQYENIEAYHDAQDAIVDLNKTRIDAIKEGIEKEIDAYEELINKKKEELSVEKDLYDFQKGVADQQKNIADIQRKLAALSSDNSASAVAKRKQLEAELVEANAELEETYYDRSIENQQNALDKELEDFKEEKDAEIEKWEEYLTNVEQVVADSLGIVQANATEIGNTLTEKAQEYNLTVSDAVLTPWKDGALAVSEYQTAFDTAASSTTTKLEEMKNKWQEVIDKMVEAGQIDVNNINAENANYAAAEKTPEPKPSESKPNNNNTNKDKAIVVGGKINASGAKIYSNINGTGYSQYFANDPIYTVLSEQGEWLKVRHHKSSSGVTGWFKKGQVKAYAKGTLGVDKDQWALINELGEELVMRADDSGKLSFMTKGSTVIPHDITENLMELGQLDPTDILNRNRPQITPSKSVINNNMEIHVDASVSELIHVEHLDGNNLDEITKVVDKAWDKKMQGLNSAIKKFSR